MNYQNFFEDFFQKVFFDRLFITLSLFQHFNLSAFLSRKRVQNYCFTAYAPNIRNTFLLKICILLHKSLIIKRCRKACFFQVHSTVQVSLTLFLNARAYTRNLPVIDCTPVTERQPLVSQPEIGGSKRLHLLAPVASKSVNGFSMVS